MNPGKWSQHYPELLKEHFASGSSFVSFAGVIGVSVKTLYEWLDKHPEFKRVKNGQPKERPKLYA